MSCSGCATRPTGRDWRQGSAGDLATRIRCPVFMIGGWADGYRNVPLRFYELLTVPRRVVIGPWNHAMPDEAVPGPRIDHVHEVVRWLDHWCRGHDTGIANEPTVVVYEQDAARPDPDRIARPGRWRAHRKWPVPGAGSRTLFLNARGGLTAAAGEDGCDGLDYDATVGTCAGLWSAGLPFGLLGDQRPDEAMSLVYTTDPLSVSEDVHILGRARAELHVSTTAAVVGFPVTLADVAPDGSSELVVNLAFRRRPPHPRVDRERGLAQRLADAGAGDQRGMVRPQSAVPADIAAGAGRRRRRTAGVSACCGGAGGASRLPRAARLADGP